jgi:hypothetical protein
METVTITKEEFDYLSDQSSKLFSLEVLGVAKWDRYGEAMELYKNAKKITEEMFGKAS